VAPAEGGSNRRSINASSWSAAVMIRSSTVRTTVTLDEDVAALVAEAMRTRNITFKEAVNEAIRTGLGPRTRGGGRFRQRTFALGFRPELDYEKALQLAASLEDEERLRKMTEGR
jgi:Arc/MetJ family transcription regulator